MTRANVGWADATDRLLRAIASTGVNPNALTILSLLPAVLAGFAAATGAFMTAALLFLASGALDLLDGAIARRTGQVTRFGALLDSTLDRISDSAVPVGLVVYFAPQGLVVVIPALAILSGMIVSYVRARAEGLSIELPRLWMRRQDRLAILILALLLGYMPAPGVEMPAFFTLVTLAGLTLLGFAAACHALVVGRAQSRSKD